MSRLNVQDLLFLLRLWGHEYEIKDLHDQSQKVAQHDSEYRPAALKHPLLFGVIDTCHAEFIWRGQQFKGATIGVIPGNLSLAAPSFTVIEARKAGSVASKDCFWAYKTSASTPSRDTPLLQP
eukprot:6181623-Pleurochrysis_carterae.AAC.2